MEDISLLRFLTVRLYSYDMNKLIELRRAKMLALSLLLIAAATFVVTLFCRPILGERREGDC
ncbi:hypothetical protein DMH20_23255 [Escherichia coli]|nr:hypothetical protein [Escherichia coli]NYY79260.1 hypothetical protein [Escherichia coli]